VKFENFLCSCVLSLVELINWYAAGEIGGTIEKLLKRVFSTKIPSCSLRINLEIFGMFSHSCVCGAESIDMFLLKISSLVEKFLLG
jgi:hypothetical protein